MSPQRIEVEFSEFSYGFALTRELMNCAPSPLRIAPQFPSLQEEGRQGGGYDVRIPFPGRPLLIQFKIPQVMVRRSFQTPRGMRPIYYRMHLRRRDLSSQHRELVRHDRAGIEVYYASPSFHTSNDFNQHFSDASMIQHSAFFSPHEITPDPIGDLPDNKAHHVAYDDGPEAWFCSKPRMIKQDISSVGFYSRIIKYSESVGSISDVREEWEKFARGVLEGTGFGPKVAPDQQGNSKIDALLAAAVAYCRSHLDAQVFIVGKKVSQ